MPGDEFEIVPKKEIEELKKDIEGIKKDPLGSAPSGQNLSGSMEKLTKSMNNMFELFKVANKEIKEEAGSLEFMKQIGPFFENLNKKMDQILEQHDKIADGIVAIADLVKQMKEESDKKAKKDAVAARPNLAPPAPTHITSSVPGPAAVPRMAPAPAIGQAPIPGRPPIMPPG